MTDPVALFYESPQIIMICLDGEGPIMGGSTEIYNQREDYEGEWA